MARNNVAANLLMFILIVAGGLGVLSSKQEVFPEFSLDQVNVSVAYPGASPSEVEQGIVLAIEEKVRGIDGVKRVDSTSKEGVGTVAVSLLLEADPQEVLADVKNEVDRIATFPEESEEPVVSLAKRRSQVVSLIVSGEHELRDLHEIAERARMGLLMRDDITQVELEGVPPLELSVEVPRAQLERYGLTLDEVAREISSASLELPAGALESDSGEIRVRVSDRRATGDEIADLILRGTRGGGELRLGDIAHIDDGYEDTKQYSLYNGHPAVRITAYRVGAETPIAVAAAVREYADTLRAELPPEVEVSIWQDDSESLRDRISLLTENAGMGLVMVLVILALFMDLRLAFWVSLGIPISFLGAFVILGGTDLSINMITLFAFIVTLGMVVDDAIVVGERTYAYRSMGHPPMAAAILAAREMAAPITFAILTTVAAFMPMLFVPGTMGKVFKMIPMVVIAVLIISLVESFFILPAHLAHAEDPKNRLPRRGVLGLFGRAQSFVASTLEAFIEKVYRPVAGLVIRARYMALAFAVASFMLTIGFVASGGIPFNFFPQIEGDVVSVQVRLPYGAALLRTEAVGDRLETSLADTVSAFGGSKYVRGVYTRVGESAPGSGPGAKAGETGSHLIAFEVALVPSGERAFSGEDFLDDWRTRTGELQDIESITYSAASGPGAGEAVAVQFLSSDEEELAAAARDFTEKLAAYDELTNIKNGYVTGKPQIDFRLSDEARSLGFTTQQLASQLRGAFFGAEAIREQRGRNELKVMARLPEAERRSEHDLEALMIRSAGGDFVPLGRLVELDRGTAPTSIEREDGRRKVVVSAELGRGVPSPKPVLDALNDGVFEDIQARYPGIDVEMVGAQREQAETFKALGRGYVLALFLIYALLAIPFRSYVQPVIIMGVIPFGFVGAILGHAFMGYGLSLMSFFGLVALSGVVVNDSLVLIDATNKERRRDPNMSAFDAVVEGGAARFRPILLTSLTTFFGLLPMLAETSMQARFLIPMAISLAFGVLAATVVVLLLVPAMYLIVEDGLAVVAAAKARLRGL
jgi:multidrug efflux pump subunit AcrB